MSYTDYTIQRGDTLSRLAGHHNTSVRDIMKLNPSISNPDLIYAGSTLRLPTQQQTTTAPKTTTTTTSKPAEPTQPGGQVPYQPQQYPYEEMTKKIFEQMPQWNMPYEDMKQRATNYAGLQVDPQLQALQRAVEQAEAAAQAQEGRISAAYSGVPEQLDRAEQKHGQRDLESAIDRGAGRSGVVDWLAAQRQEHYGGLLAQTEAQKAAELTAIANQLGLTHEQAAEQMQNLEGMRGNLTQQHLAQLEDQGYSRGMDAWQGQMSAAQQLSQLAQQWDEGQRRFALDTFDRTMLRPDQRWNIYHQGADIMGETPEGLVDHYGNMPGAPEAGGGSSGGGGSYTVKSGDTLSRIASRNNMTLAQLLKLNPQFRSNPNLIHPGQTVKLG